MKLRKAIITTVSLLFTCYEAQAYTVGVLMPTQNEDRWYQEGFALEQELKSKGFNVELFYGGDSDVELQNRQIKRLSENNVDALVIGSIDGNALSESLKEARDKNIPVISYDRMITGTDAITYHVTFDNLEAGRLQGQYLIDKLKPTVDSPKNIEIFYGALDDKNSHFFYEEAMRILKPYIEEGSLVVKSGKITADETNVPGWRTDLASKRMDELMDSVGYSANGGVKLDGILSPADCISDGIIFTLKKRGYTPSDIPVITGQDATVNALKNVKEGYQSMTIYKSSDELHRAVTDMVKALSTGQKANVNDTATYNNGVKNMESYLCTPELVDSSNLAKLL